MQRLLLTSLASAVIAATTSAQMTLVIPNGAANAAGNDSNAFPWGTTAASYAGLRLMAVYGGVNFTAQGVNTPVTIDRLKWRPDENASSYSGGTFSIATIELSTSPTGFAGVSTNYATNHGADRTVVYDASVSGPVTYSTTPGSGAWTPQSWCVDVILTTPFLYDPTQGDLVIDVDYPGGSFSGGSVGQMDTMSAGSNGSRIWASSNYPAANGSSVQSDTPVVEVGYGAGAGYARNTLYGTGCYQVDNDSFYEYFLAGTHDLSNSGMSILAAGPGYLAIGGLMSLYPTTGATPLTLSDDDEVTMPLNSGFIPYGIGGQATSLTICSNGFVAVGSNGTGYSPSAATFLGAANTGWWCWHDYNPTAAGSGQVLWEETATAVYVTWDNVYSFGATSGGNTFQFQFEKASGNVHLVFGSIDNSGNDHLVGFSEGGASNDPGSVDLSAVLPATIAGNYQQDAIAIEASARPVIGTSFDLNTTNIPAGSLFGGILFGLQQYDPGIPLGAIGMPGCEQYVSSDAVFVFTPTGSSYTYPYTVPNDPGLAGLRIKVQSAAYTPGVNLLNAVSSNGLQMLFDLN